jgi:hypothetical protein
MKDKRCLICKYRGKINLDTRVEYIYEGRGKIQGILLCYSHSIELFKFGQRSFIERHRSTFTGFHGIEQDRFSLDIFNVRI